MAEPQATKPEPEEHDPFPSDPRLLPGGAHGTRADPGMSSLDREIATSGGQSTGQTKYGETPE